MALDAIKGSSYRSVAGNAARPEYKTNEVTIQEAGTVNINVADVPAASRAYGGEQNDGFGQKDKEQTASEKQIKNAISRANNKMKNHRTRCEFSYHEETKRVSIKIMDEDTKEVIKEIPPEETLEMLEKMWELAGIMIDERR